VCSSFISLVLLFPARAQIAVSSSAASINSNVELHIMNQIVPRQPRRLLFIARCQNTLQNAPNPVLKIQKCSRITNHIPVHLAMNTNTPIQVIQSTGAKWKPKVHPVTTWVFFLCTLASWQVRAIVQFRQTAVKICDLIRVDNVIKLEPVVWLTPHCQSFNAIIIIIIIIIEFV